MMKKSRKNPFDIIDSDIAEDFLPFYVEKIVWHRPKLSTVLMYVDEKFERNLLDTDTDTLEFERDLTMELQHQTEEKKQELLLFLQSI